MPFERGEIPFSKGFPVYTDIRKLQDKANTSYTLSTRRLRFVYYDVEGHPLNFGKYPQKSDLEIEPELLVDMVRICRIIAPHFPYVRIDFFVNHGTLQIGELTFTPSAGLKPDLNYGDGDRKMGEMLDISGLLAGNG